MPDFTLFQLLGFGGTGLATSLAVLGLFWKADDAFSNEFREALSNKLQRMKVDTSEANWPLSFARMFDRIFGDRYLSLKCFGRSCLASALAVLLLSALNLSLYPGQYELFDAEQVLVIVFIAVSFNFIPDYISLVETRWIVRVLTRHNFSGAIIFAILIADLIVTIFLFFVVGGGFVFSLIVLVRHFAPTLYPALDLSFADLIVRIYDTLILHGIYLIPTGAPFSFGVFLYSTLFTSAWIWLFVAGWFVVRNGSRFQKVLAILQFALPIRTKPMRALGEVAALVTALTFIFLGILGFDPDRTNNVTVSQLISGRL